MMEVESVRSSERAVTRRKFIKGVIAAGATVSASGYLFRGGALAALPSAQGSVERLITLNVNGQQRRVDVMKQETLAMTLRYKLGLTGTKLGCDRAECGACTVLIDGVTHYGCSMLTHQVRGRAVTTIEGLEQDGVLHPVQQAVLDEGGFQCAFCAPGFVMSMVGMLDRNPNPTREEAAQLLSGNLCRCADYNKILNTAMRAAELTPVSGLRRGEDMAENVIGTDIAPPDLRAKITGRARYAEDFRADGMVFAKLLLSPMPHARVRSVDARAALAMEGVLGILRADEVPQAEGVGEACLTDEPKYEGEPILAVAAVDETTAAAAIEAIKVDLEPLPFVLNPLDSLRPGGPDARLDGNVFRGRDLETLKWTQAEFDEAGEDRLPMGEPTAEWAIGEVEAGFAEADVIVEETVVHQSVTHHPMEPRSAMAYWQNGKLFLHGSTQSTARCRMGIAGALDMDVEDVVMVAEYCGGGFGSKITVSPTMLIPALLSQKINRPVMLRITRYEEHYVGRARAGLQGWAKIGFRSDGRMTALDLYLVQDGGPYGRTSDLFTAGTVASLNYQPETMRFRGVSVYTNTPPKSAQRAPGGAQIIAMLEPPRRQGGPRAQCRSPRDPKDQRCRTRRLDRSQPCRAHERLRERGPGPGQ